MIEIISGAAIGIGSGIGFALYSINNVFGRRHKKNSSDLNDLKYMKRSRFIKEFSDDLKSVLLEPSQDNVSLEGRCQDIIGRYEPLYRIYFSGTCIEDEIRNILKSLKKSEGCGMDEDAKKEIANHFMNLSKVLEENQALLWV